MTRRAAAWLVSVLLVLATGLVMPGTAAAHTVLKFSNPAAGQVLRAAPAQLELAFNEKLRAGTAAVAVTVGDAKPVEVEIQVGEDTITSDLSAEPLAEVPEGEAVRWKIGYRIVSEDGHPVSGVLEFVVDRTLLSSSPTEGAVLSALPPELELRFGRSVASVDPVAVAAGDTPEQQVSALAAGESVRVSLAGLEPTTGAGPQQYRVGYRLTDDTGEILTGLLLFTVDPAAGTAPAPLPPVSTTAARAVVPTPQDPAASTAAASTVAPSASTAPTVATGVLPATTTSPADELLEATAPVAESGSRSLIWIVLAIILLLGAGTAVAVVRRRSRPDQPA